MMTQEAQVNKSDMFREMYENGMSVAAISKETGSHYSYVHGVIQRHCNKKGVEMRKERKESRSDKIRELAMEGKKVGQIAKELNANYSFVFSVVKKFREDNPDLFKTEKVDLSK